MWIFKFPLCSVGKFPQIGLSISVVKSVSGRRVAGGDSYGPAWGLQWYGDGLAGRPSSIPEILGGGAGYAKRLGSGENWLPASRAKLAVASPPIGADKCP